MGLYGNKFINSFNILYDIRLEQEYERSYSEFCLIINEPYVLESNINDKVNIIINKIKELWNNFKTFVKDCFNKIREFIKKLLKIKPKQNLKNDKNQKETYEEYRKRTGIKISWYKMKNFLAGAFADLTSEIMTFTSYSDFLIKNHYKTYKDIELSELDNWFEEKIKECIEDSDKKFEKHKEKIH